MRVQAFAAVCPLSRSLCLRAVKVLPNWSGFPTACLQPFPLTYLSSNFLFFFFFLGFTVLLCFSSISCNQVKGVSVDRGDLYSAFVWYLLFPNGAACCKKSQMLPICCRAPLNYGGWMFTAALAVAFSPYSSKWYVFTSNYWDRESGLVSEVCHLVAYP